MKMCLVRVVRGVKADMPGTVINIHAEDGEYTMMVVLIADGHEQRGKEQAGENYTSVPVRNILFPKSNQIVNP